MSQVNYLLPDAIAQVAEYAAFSILVQQRFAALPVQNIIIQLYDTVPESVLDALAGENDMLGYNGWYFCTTVQMKRDMLKNADKLKSTIGTAAAIINALALAGVPDAIVVENLGGLTYNGQHIYDGSVTYSGYHWSDFKVQIPNAIFTTLTTQQLYDYTQLINAYKRAICHLVDIEGY